MDRLRLRFEKTGRASYISHLDLMRTMQRVFLRAGLPLKYSEGFNPHAELSFALPLSVGMESLCELMDFKLKQSVALDNLPDQLTSVMPEGLRVLEVYSWARKFRDLKWLRITGRLDYDARRPEEMSAALHAFYAQKTITVRKKTKHGEADADIIPAVHNIAFVSSPTGVSLSAVISAQEPTLNPELLIAALRQRAPELVPDFAVFRRLETLDADMQVFR